MDENIKTVSENDPTAIPAPIEGTPVIEPPKEEKIDPLTLIRPSLPTSITSNEELEIIFEKHEEWIESVYHPRRDIKWGQRAILTNLDLRGKDLSDRKLKYVDFSGSNLEETNFSNSDLSGAKFCGCNLARSDLRNSRCLKTDFSEANLDSAKLANGNFNQANFKQANLEGISFSGAILKDAVFQYSRKSDELKSYLENTQ